MSFSNSPLFTRYRPWLSLSALFLIASSFLRIVLWFDFGRDENVTLADLFSALSIGLLNDAIVLVYFLGIVTLFNLIIPNKIYQSKNFALIS